jgi:hypothetical protein
MINDLCQQVPSWVGGGRSVVDEMLEGLVNLNRAQISSHFFYPIKVLIQSYTDIPFIVSKQFAFLQQWLK